MRNNKSAIGQLVGDRPLNKNVKYDPGSDTLYLFIQEGYEAKFIEVAPGINVELDDNGQSIGIEILNAARLLPLIGGGQPSAQPQELLLNA